MLIVLETLNQSINQSKPTSATKNSFCSALQNEILGSVQVLHFERRIHVFATWIQGCAWLCSLLTVSTLCIGHLWVISSFDIFLSLFFGMIYADLARNALPFYVFEFKVFMAEIRWIWWILWDPAELIEERRFFRLTSCNMLTLLTSIEPGHNSKWACVAIS